MTSSPTTKPAGRKKIAPFGRESTNVLALVCLYSLLICLWSLSVGYRISPSSQEYNEVESAALVLASDLMQVAVPSRHFGLIGIADQTTKNGQTISAANAVSGNIRASAAIAAEYDLKHMQKFVQEDLADLDRAKAELARTLRSAVQPNYYTDLADGTRRSLYERAYKLITERNAGSERVLVDLKIQLGALRSAQAVSSIPFIGLPQEALPYNDGNFYRTSVVVPVPKAGSVRFYDLAEQVKLSPINEFAPVAESELGSVVKIDAIFESTVKDGFQKMISRESACARMGSPLRTRPVSALLVSFPSGAVAPLSCLQDLLRARYSPVAGDWHQAVDADVPGGGHLAPPLGLDTAEAPCDKAIQMALYNWFVTMGPNLDPANFGKAARSKWFAQPIQGAVSDLSVNSAVVRDTGAPQFALLYQSKPGGQGQQVLVKAFSGGPTELPRSAIPLLIDETGGCNLPGRLGMDLTLVKEFLDQLHRTNVASIESRSVAHTVFVRMSSALDTSSGKIAGWSSELRDLERVAGKEKVAARRLLLSEKIARETREKNKYETLKRKAAIAESNASAAAAETFLIASDLKKFCESGLNRVSGKLPGFLLNKSEVFVPHPEALSEEDLYEVTTHDTDPKSWTSPSFIIKGVADQDMLVEGMPIVEFWKVAQTQLKTRSAYFVISSAQISTKGGGTIQSLAASPFNRSGIPKSQLLFYSGNALQTGSNPAVKWSCLLRDLVAFREKDTGQPVPAVSDKWSEQTGGPAPGLACEIQIRSPVPVIPDLPGGYSALNQDTKEVVNLIPPMPADML